MAFDGPDARNAGPPQVDYRAQPNIGGAGVGGRPEDYGQPNSDVAHPVSPQPRPIGGEGYTLNALAAKENQMAPDSGPAGPGQTPANPDPDPTTLGAWDFWETT